MQLPDQNKNQELELVFLGTGNAFSMAKRYWGSILVNNTILFDPSPIVVPHMKLLDRSLSALENIFITHFHADHYFGLPFILLDYAYIEPPDHPLTIIGPAGVMGRMAQLLNLGFPGLFDKLKDKVLLKYLEVTDSGRYQAYGLEFDAFNMEHGGISMDAYGYKISLGGKTIGYTGDTDLCDGLYRLAEGLDILIIEFSNPDLDVPGHISQAKLEKLRERLDERTKIILNHIGTITEDISQDQNVIIPKDLAIYKF